MARNQIRRKETRLKDREQLFIGRTIQALGMSESDIRRYLSSNRLSAVRINPLAKRKSDLILKDLLDLDDQLEPISWLSDAYFVSDKTNFTQSDLFKEGEIYVQTASSLIPALALDPRPAERIIDLCAAPGGKACHIAAISRGKSELWVNDSSKARVKKLQDVLAWQNVHPKSVTQLPAQYIDKFVENDNFDRVLLDAQCTGEGRIDLSSLSGGLQFWSLKRIHEYGRLQQRMLKSAYKLIKPGGVLVYSTCTIAPEENELPINQLIRHTDATIEPFTLDIPEASPGLTRWEGVRLDQSIKGALRIRPSFNMEAFFVCKIRRPTNSSRSATETA